MSVAILYALGHGIEYAERDDIQYLLGVGIVYAMSVARVLAAGCVYAHTCARRGYRCTG